MSFDASSPLFIPPLSLTPFFLNRSISLSEGIVMLYTEMKIDFSSMEEKLARIPLMIYNELIYGPWLIYGVNTN